MRKISSDEAREKYGISAAHQVMNNGECRFRLLDNSGRGYIRTEASDRGGWQNSHSHKHTLETYIVEEEWIGIATLQEGAREKLGLKILRSGSIWTAPIGVTHNVYMAARALTHVVKHGGSASSDWVTTPESQKLDMITSKLSEIDLLRLAKENS